METERTLITPAMVSNMALASLSDSPDFMNSFMGKVSLFTPAPDNRTKWQKTKDRVASRVNRLRHRVACWITPYGFDEDDG